MRGKLAVVGVSVVLLAIVSGIQPTRGAASCDGVPPIGGGTASGYASGKKAAAMASAVAQCSKAAAIIAGKAALLCSQICTSKGPTCTALVSSTANSCSASDCTWTPKLSATLPDGSTWESGTGTVSCSKWVQPYCQCMEKTK